MGTGKNFPYYLANTEVTAIDFSEEMLKRATEKARKQGIEINLQQMDVQIGMVIVGLPYSETRQFTLDEISGGRPYGASTIAAGDGSRLPSENELAMARFQGRHVATIAKKLAGT